jgi:hypothetical protein
MICSQKFQTNSTQHYPIVRCVLQFIGQAPENMKHKLKNIVNITEGGM